MAASGAPIQRQRGPTAVLADLAATMVAIAQTRFAVLGMDVNHAVFRLVILLSWWVAALFALGLAAAIGVFAILLALGNEHRLPVLVGMAITLVLFGVAAMAVALERARRWPRWFDGTLEELEKDDAILRALRS